MAGWLRQSSASPSDPFRGQQSDQHDHDGGMIPKGSDRQRLQTQRFAVWKRVQQPIHVASQQWIIRWMVDNVEVIRHRRGRWWCITGEQRQETRFPTDVGTEERREVRETRPALLLRG